MSILGIGTMTLAAGVHPSYRLWMEFPLEEDKGDAILGDHIDLMAAAQGGVEREVDKD